MQNFIDSLTYDQVFLLKQEIDKKFNELQNLNEEFIKKELLLFTPKGLKKIKRRFEDEQNNARSNKEFNFFEIRIKVINDILSSNL